jgi:GT2 family glycosyltransferase
MVDCVAKASVIVAAYRESANVCFVLHALARQTIRPAEVVIADDGSEPGLKEAVAGIAGTMPFRLVHVWQPDEGFRAARSRNNGIRQAGHDVVGFLDQDTLPHADWLETHLAHIGPRRVCLARILPLDAADSERLSVEAVAGGAFEKWHARAHYRKLRRQQKKYLCYALMRRLGLPFKLTRPSLSSGNVSAWRTDLRKVNGFDEAYVGWGQEDDDLGRRMYMAGVVPVPLLDRAFVSHIHHPVERPGWRAGPNLERYRRRPSSAKCELGLDRHPHADVVATVLRP